MKPLINWLFLKRILSTSCVLFTLSAPLHGCANSKETSSDALKQRPIDMTAKPTDPLSGQRAAPVVPITNIHEHLMSESELAPLLSAMDQTGIERTIVLGSPIFTFLLGNNGFTHYDENNDLLLGLAQLEPDRIVPFVVIHPDDEDAPQKLEAYVARGARGVKLFAGHGAKWCYGQYPGQ